LIDGRRVIAWVPYGRHTTVSILLEYLQRDHDRGLVDELWLCMNTAPSGQEADQAWAILIDRKRDWVKIKRRPDNVTVHSQKQRQTGYFYRYMINPDTIYVRFDDDVVYVHDDTIERLVLRSIHGEQACTFPVIINNAICSHYLQMMGKIPKEWGEVGLDCMDPIGWSNGRFAQDLHELFLSHVDNGTVEELFSHMDFQLPLGEQFSVSCFASRGSMYANLKPPGVLMPDQILEEEHWHTEVQPRRLGVPNIIIGNALVSHFTFYPQHPWFFDVDGNPANDVLDRYRTLAKGLL
jgi:hypothetical protein